MIFQRTLSAPRFASPLVLPVLLALLLAGVGRAQYPKINLAVGYEVVAEWPKRPDNVRWRFVTGVAVDRHDRAAEQ